MARAVIAARRLGRRYGGVQALRDLHLDVAAGEVVALLGANGSGKTTALRCLAGELVPTSGGVRIAGADPHVEPDGERARRALAFVSDTPVFYRELTVKEHVHLIAAAFDDLDGIDRAMDVLDELGVADKRDARPHELSSGQRQKVVLACAHARPFSALLLDEPVLRLDPASQQWLHDRLVDHARDGVAIVLTTHQPRFADGLADRVVQLADGVVVREQPYDEFLASGWGERIGDRADEHDDPDAEG